jgi:hypothetical protein
VHQEVHTAPRTPAEEAYGRLIDARTKVLAHEKALRDIEEEQERRRRDLAATKLSVGLGQERHGLIVALPVVEFKDWKHSKKLLERSRDAIIALQQQISRGNREHRRNKEALARARADAAVAATEVAKYGRLLTLPERRKARRRARRDADER